jgi:hypothetical protein
MCALQGSAGRVDGHRVARGGRSVVENGGAELTGEVALRHAGDEPAVKSQPRAAELPRPVERVGRQPARRHPDLAGVREPRQHVGGDPFTGGLVSLALRRQCSACPRSCACRSRSAFRSARSRSRSSSRNSHGSVPVEQLPAGLALELAAGDLDHEPLREREVRSPTPRRCPVGQTQKFAHLEVAALSVGAGDEVGQHRAGPLPPALHRSLVHPEVEHTAAEALAAAEGDLLAG